jgi:hypothetical protein
VCVCLQNHAKGKKKFFFKETYISGYFIFFLFCFGGGGFQIGLFSLYIIEKGFQSYNVAFFLLHYNTNQY